MARGVMVEPVAAAPNVTFVNISNSSMEFVPASSTEVQALLAAVAGAEALSALQPILPYCAAVKNNSSSTIETTTVVWSLRSQDGLTALNVGKFDVIGSGVRPEETVLMAPISGLSRHMIRQGAGGGTTLRDPNYLAAAVTPAVQRYSERSEIVVSLDSIIFQDGTLIGPDAAGKLNEINSERAIKRELATELLRLPATERSSFLSAIKNRPDPPGIEGMAALLEDPRKRFADMFEDMIAAADRYPEYPDLFQSTMEDIIKNRAREIRRRNS